jgi:hypothetical protein
MYGPARACHIAQNQYAHHLIRGQPHESQKASVVCYLDVVTALEHHYYQ